MKKFNLCKPNSIKIIVTFLFIICCSIFILSTDAYAYTDTEIAKNTSKHTFSVAIQGAHSLKIELAKYTSKPATVKIYKNSIFKKNLIVTGHFTKTFVKRNIIKSGNSYYKIVVTCPSKNTIKCISSQYVDTKSTSKATIWEPSTFPELPNYYNQCTFITKKIFLPKAQVDDAIKLVNNDKCLKVYNTAIKMGITAGTTYLTSNVKWLKRASSNIFIAMGFTGAASAFDLDYSLQKLSISQLKKVAGYKNGKAQNNVCITYTSNSGNPVPVIWMSYSKWDGKTCKCEPGYKGTFREFK